MSLKSIDRISMPDVETFFREYVFKRKPVIITDLFHGEEIRTIQSLEDAKRIFGSVKLVIDYTYPKNSAEPGQIMTFNEYWDFVKANPSTRLSCGEYEIPASIMTLFKLPMVCHARDLKEEEVLSLPRKYGDHDLFANLFVANRGNKAHMHWDGDHRQVFLYQVFGRKQVILFQPERSIYLKPLDSRVPNSGVFLDRMTEEEKLAFVDMNDGYYDTVYPTETLYMPMLIWHYLEYTDHAMSFNVRFGRNKFGRLFCVDNFHRDCYIQCFASKLADAAACEEKYPAIINSVIAKYIEPAANLRDKIKEMRKLFKGICLETFPEARMEEYCPQEREQEEIEKIVQDIGPMRYIDPKMMAQTRPSGPIMPRQKELIKEQALKCGYPSGVLQQLLLNRLGKSHIDMLTKAEAVQFISYLKSPGASWVQ